MEARTIGGIVMSEKHLRGSCRIQDSRTAFIIAALTIILSTAIATVAGPHARLIQAEAPKNFAALMTQAKLQADLGNHRQAAEAFASIVNDVTAPAALRSEARVRRGLALNAAGDIRASKEVFIEAMAGSSADPKAFRFLTYAVARTVPGKIWSGFRSKFEELLKSADVVSFEELARGDPAAKRVHLKKDEIELRAVWRPFPPSGDGAQRSYRAEIAAYELDKMLGLNMVPPTVERIIEGRFGSIQLWVNGCRSYNDVQEKTPATSDWNHQVARMNLFDALIGNVDRNGANLLVDPDSEMVLIDHVFAFSNETELRNPPTQFDRRLLANLRALRKDELQIRLKGILGAQDMENVLKRRNALLAHYAKLAAEKGETAILF
jgi:hypothetical protein